MKSSTLTHLHRFKRSILQPDIRVWRELSEKDSWEPVDKGAPSIAYPAFYLASSMYRLIVEKHNVSLLPRKFARWRRMQIDRAAYQCQR